MKVKEKSIEERKRELLANPNYQAIIKVKTGAVEKFLETADLSALRERRG